jgi:hypothetical protein
MHGFNLVLGSLLAFPWAQELLVSAQRVVTYFRASHQPLALLRSAAERLAIERGLHSANKTRFTSKHECVESVLRHQPAFSLVLNQQRTAINNSDVLAVIDDVSFWADLTKLNKVMLPLTKVIMAVQGNDSTLADVCRWVAAWWWGVEAARWRHSSAVWWCVGVSDSVSCTHLVLWFAPSAPAQGQKQGANAMLLLPPHHSLPLRTHAPGTGCTS